MSNRIFVALIVAWACVMTALPQNTTAQSSQTKSDPRTLTVTGCLERGAAPGTFLLTKVADPLVDSVAASGGGAIPTVTYQLSGGQNLAAHLGHKVEVTGRGPLKPQTPKKVADTETKYEPGGSKAPKVEVKEKAAVAVRPLTVESFKMISTDCLAK